MKKMTNDEMFAVIGETIQEMEAECTPNCPDWPYESPLKYVEDGIKQLSAKDLETFRRLRGAVSK